MYEIINIILFEMAEGRAKHLSIDNLSHFNVPIMCTLKYSVACSKKIRPIYIC